MCRNVSCTCVIFPSVLVCWPRKSRRRARHRHGKQVEAALASHAREPARQRRGRESQEEEGKKEIGGKRAGRRRKEEGTRRESKGFEPYFEPRLCRKIETPEVADGKVLCHLSPLVPLSFTCCQCKKTKQACEAPSCQKAGTRTRTCEYTQVHTSV